MIICEDCVIEILKFLSFKKLHKCRLVSKNIKLRIDDLIYNYDDKTVLKTLRYSINTDNRLLFKQLEPRLKNNNQLYHLLQFSAVKNPVYLYYILKNYKIPNSILKMCVLNLLNNFYYKSKCVQRDKVYPILTNLFIQLIYQDKFYAYEILNQCKELGYYKFVEYFNSDFFTVNYFPNSNNLIYNLK